MNKIVEQALAEGKIIREKLDQQAREQAEKLENQRLIELAEKQDRLKKEADRCMSYLPQSLAGAVAERKK